MVFSRDLQAGWCCHILLYHLCVSVQALVFQHLKQSKRAAADVIEWVRLLEEESAAIDRTGAEFRQACVSTVAPCMTASFRHLDGL